MRINRIRRLTLDDNHNMCTAAKWFQGNLYVAYRQGDAHVCPYGKLVVQRSRDQGVNFETVAVGRGTVDTRDAHLYSVDDQRLVLAGFESGNVAISGAMGTENGMNWSPWTRYTGADGWWLWHPEYFRGRYYCAGYTWKPNWSAVAWFESDDGFAWRKVRVLREGAEQPSECNLVFRADGTALLMVRRDHASHKPLLMTARPPYSQWDAQEIDLPIEGLAMWLVGNSIWFSGRWFLSREAAQMGVFTLNDGKPELKLVLPAGPNFDFSYMGVAQHPLNSARFTLSYYSNHAASADPRVDQWSHPAIYLVDAYFASEFIQRWKVSDVLALPGGLAGASYPGGDSALSVWHDLEACTTTGETGLVDAHPLIAGRAGVIYLATEFDIGPMVQGALHLGYDGPVRVWLNGTQVFQGPGTNPAIVDQTSIPVRFEFGRNRLVVALDTNGGKAWGIFGRYEVKA